jgi:thiol-disulfide isomerase/thioredoxin
MNVLERVRNVFFCVIFRKNALILAMCLTFFSCPAHADRMDIPMEVKDAFAKAGLPLLREKQEARDFTLKTIDGGEVALSGLQGQVVFLNFWATWCPPCRAEMPSMENLYQRFKDQGLAFAAVDLMERAGVVEHYLRENGITFPVLLDSSGMAGSQYGVQAVPSTFILDRDGKIILYAAGARDWDTPDMLDAFDKLLNHER